MDQKNPVGCPGLGLELDFAVDEECVEFVVFLVADAVDSQDNVLLPNDERRYLKQPLVQLLADVPGDSELFQ